MSLPQGPISQWGLSFWEFLPISNMKIISMLDAQAKQARVELEESLVTFIEVVEDEIIPLREKVAKLDDDLDEMKKEKQ